MLGQRCPIFNRVPSPRLLSVSPAALGAGTEFWRLPSGPFHALGCRLSPFDGRPASLCELLVLPPWGLAGMGPCQAPAVTAFPPLIRSRHS